jgi:hypothetical protein
MAIQPSGYYRGTEKAFWQPFPGMTGFHPDIHMGVDFAGKAAGSPLVAAERGTVTRAEYDRYNGGGWVIEVEIKPGVRYSYNHCQVLYKWLGAKVTKGQTIAAVGATGTIATSSGFIRSTYGVHCHTVMTVREKGSDGVYRTMMHDFADFMSGGSRAGSTLIQPPSSGTQRIYIGAGINIRRGPSTGWAIARTTKIGGQYDSPYPYLVNGQKLTSGSVVSDDWRTVRLDGLTCYVWAPLSRRV